MKEIELKFQIPAGQRRALEAAVARPAGRPRLRLQAVYFDTPTRELAQAGLALRLRREGPRWAQTLKGEADDGITRLEHNVVRVGRASTAPALDPSLHDGTPAGDALQHVLAGRAADMLVVQYRTDILRRTKTLRAPGVGGSVELALDVGHIIAGARTLRVQELEIELLRGSPLAVIETARRWSARFGLWLDTRSKAERGDLLARVETIAPPRRATAPLLVRELSMAAAWQQVLRSCADQIIANASQIASGEHLDEHVHQLRVGLRRLRSALSLFKGRISPSTADALAEPARELFRQLGRARDRDVIVEQFAAGLRDALHSAGLDGDAPLPSPARADATPAALVRGARAQQLLLDILAAMQAPGDAAADHDTELRAALGHRLQRWHRQVMADANRFATLDDAGRHRLRKRAKRLRYAVEFCAALFERRAVRRYLRSLTKLLERLGAFSDAVMAMNAFVRELGVDGSGRARDQERAMFAIGWLAAQRERLLARAGPSLKAFASAQRFWTHRTPKRP